MQAYIYQMLGIKIFLSNLEPVLPTLTTNINQQSWHFNTFIYIKFTQIQHFDLLTKLSAIEPKEVKCKICLYSWTTSHNRKKAQSNSPSLYKMYSNVQSHQMHHESRWSKLEITNSLITHFLFKIFLGIPHPIYQMIYYES